MAMLHWYLVHGMTISIPLCFAIRLTESILLLIPSRLGDLDLVILRRHARFKTQSRLACQLASKLFISSAACLSCPVPWMLAGGGSQIHQQPIIHLELQAVAYSVILIESNRCQLHSPLWRVRVQSWESAAEIARGGFFCAVCHEAICHGSREKSHQMWIPTTALLYATLLCSCSALLPSDNSYPLYFTLHTTNLLKCNCPFATYLQSIYSIINYWLATSQTLPYNNPNLT